MLELSTMQYCYLPKLKNLAPAVLAYSIQQRCKTFRHDMMDKLDIKKPRQRLRRLALVRLLANNEFSWFLQLLHVLQTPSRCPANLPFLLSCKTNTYTVGERATSAPFLRCLCDDDDDDDDDDAAAAAGGVEHNHHLVH